MPPDSPTATLSSSFFFRPRLEPSPRKKHVVKEGLGDDGVRLEVDPDGSVGQGGARVPYLFWKFQITPILVYWFYFYLLVYIILK